MKDEETGQWLRPSGIGEEITLFLKQPFLKFVIIIFLVEPVEGSQELNNADLITVPMKNIGTAPQPNVGDIIEIAYNGEIAESYPAQITGGLRYQSCQRSRTMGFNSYGHGKWRVIY